MIDANNGELTPEQRAQRIVESWKVVKTPSYQLAKVTNAHEYTRENGQAGVLVSLNLCNAFGEAQANEQIKAGDLQGAMNNNLSIFTRNGMDYQPRKREVVKVFCDFITTKSGEQALMVDHLLELPLGDATSAQVTSEQTVAPKEDDVVDSDK